MMRNLPSEPVAASIEDHQAIVNLIKGAASWLPTMGTDQWAKPWPSLAERDERIRQGLETASTWMVWDGATAVATITSFRHGSTFLWTAEERRVPAVYLNRVCMNRDYAGQGIGAELIDWASEKAAAEYGTQVSRIDVWSTNIKLHNYYRGIGFRFLRMVDDSIDYPSGALFERPIAAGPGV